MPEDGELKCRKVEKERLLMLQSIATKGPSEKLDQIPRHGNVFKYQQPSKWVCTQKQEREQRKESNTIPKGSDACELAFRNLTFRPSVTFHFRHPRDATLAGRQYTEHDTTASALSARPVVPVLRDGGSFNPTGTRWGGEGRIFFWVGNLVASVRCWGASKPLRCCLDVAGEANEGHHHSAQQLSCVVCCALAENRV